MIISGLKVGFCPSVLTKYFFAEKWRIQRCHRGETSQNFGVGWGQILHDHLWQGRIPKHKVSFSSLTSSVTRFLHSKSDWPLENLGIEKFSNVMIVALKLMICRNETSLVNLELISGQDKVQQVIYGQEYKLRAYFSQPDGN